MTSRHPFRVMRSRKTIYQRIVKLMFYMMKSGIAFRLHGILVGKC